MDPHKYDEQAEATVKGWGDDLAAAMNDGLSSQLRPKLSHSLLVERITEAAAEYAERTSMSDGSPDTIPEVARELGVQTGQIDAVFRRLGEVVALISPVMSTSPVKLISTDVPRAKGPDLATEVGTCIRRNTEMLGDLEDFLVRVREAIRI